MTASPAFTPGALPPPSKRPGGTLGVGGRVAGLLVYPETVAVALLVVAFGVGAMLSKYFLNVHSLLDSTSLYMETGVMALGMTFVIISGNIDLSVASNLGLTAVVVGLLHGSLGVPMGVAAMAGPVFGGLLGGVNGLLVTRLRLPSLTVTLGTLALYRGLAQVVGGDVYIKHLPEWFVGIDYRWIGGVAPMPLVIFLVLATVAGVVLKKSVFGRCVYALGTNEGASHFTGIRVEGVKLTVFVLSGVCSGVAAVMMLSRQGMGHWDMAGGDELAVITAVVLGGTDIFGGRGSVFGTVVALFLLGVIRKGMGLANIPAEYQRAITGGLLVAAVLLARLSGRIGARLARSKV